MQQLVAEVLSAWRRAEHLVEKLAPDDPARDMLIEVATRLQDIYSDLTAYAATEQGVATPSPAITEGESPA